MELQPNLMELEPHSRCRRFLRKVRADEWLNLVEADSIEPEELYARLKTNWTTTGSVSGLVSGFTYIASHTDTVYSQTDTAPQILSDHRVHIFGLISMLSFIISMFATLFASGLYGLVNVLGVEHVNWFVKHNYYLIDLPLFLCCAGIGLMLFSAFVSIGGIVYPWVFWVIFSLGCFSSLGFICVFWRLQRQMYTRILNMRDRDVRESRLSAFESVDD